MSTPVLSDAEYQQLILADIADDGTVRKALPSIWKLYAPWASYNAVDGLYSLQYLYARRHGLFMLMGSVRRKIPYTARDRKQELNRLFEYLQAMYELTDTEIKKAMDQYINSSEPAVDQLTVTIPYIDSPLYFPQPDDLGYSGAPNFPKPASLLGPP